MLSWSPRDAPGLQDTVGRYVRVTPLIPERDADALFTALGGEHDAELWRYIPFGPPESADALMRILSAMTASMGWQTHVFRDPARDVALGMSSYMRIRPEVGSAEVGAVIFSRTMQRTPAATEAMFLMARHVFGDRGYRRFEWKCDNENIHSKRAADRLGFSFEGVFREDLVVKGKNRVTAWYSMIDREWPRIETAFEKWLAPENFDPDGGQRASLAALRPLELR
jgi:RimJ/RimL family protein N-acetyltransferase